MCRITIAVLVVLLCTGVRAAEGPVTDGLLLWLKADAGVTAVERRVSAWADQSGQGRDATATETARPTLVTREGAMPLVHFDGRGHVITFPRLTTIRTGCWVVRQEDARWMRFLLGDGTSADFHRNGDGVGGELFSGAGVKRLNGLTAPGRMNLPPNRLAIVTIRAEKALAASNFSQDRQFADRLWQGDLGELLLYDRPLSDAEITQVEAYLAAKWAIPLLTPETYQPAEIILTYPGPATALTAPASTTVAAQVVEHGLPVGQLELYDGEKKIGDFPLRQLYRLLWSRISAGEHRLTARATDYFGTVSTSPVVICRVAEAPGTWKTAYISRGKMGEYQAAWAGGVGATLRMPTPLPLPGSKARIVARSFYGEGAPIELAKMVLVHGTDYSGTVAGPRYPITFLGQPGVVMPRSSSDLVSDEVSVPLTPGIWYVDDRYLSSSYTYAYSTAPGYCQAGDQFDQERLTGKVNVRTGVLLRLDVFTTDTRPLVACYGDSITFGYASTVGAEQDYPTQLGKLLDLPVLNLGVNGDQFTYAGGSVGLLNELCGVERVIYMMGINDLIGGRWTDAQPYVKIAQQLITQLHQAKKQVFWGTIPPATGYGKYADDPVKERVRQEINTWIRTQCPADGIIDFDKALADPATPARYRAELHCGDWLHPNDAGYTVMAETAAAVLKDKGR